MSEHEHDLLVIGAGPGGYVAAIRAAQLGLNVACVESKPALGGTCARVGCIPSKALLEASERYHQAKRDLADFGVIVKGVELDLKKMMARKDAIVKALTDGVDHLFRANKVTRYTGHGRLVGQGRVSIERAGEMSSVKAAHVIVATGSKLAPLSGVELDGDRIGSSTEALSYPEVPAHLVVIGAGYIGLELGSVWARLGSKVTILESLDRILPGMDLELASEAQKLLAKQGLDFRLGTRVTRASAAGERCTVTVDGDAPLECDRVLLSAGRLPNTDGVGLESVGVATDERGRIVVDEHFRTNVPGIYAIGDVVLGPMLAHKAEEEGIACVERIVTGFGHVNYGAIPAVVYTSPEIASVGRSEEELKAQGVPYKKGVFPFLANGRARILKALEGRIKVLAAADTDRIVGVHIIGAHAGDLIAEAAVAIEFGASAEDLARSTHAHPTLAEALKEAALAVGLRSIHV